MISLVPLEQISAPSELDGSNPSDRHNENSLLAARNDVEAVFEWLDQYQDNPNTFRNFKKEVERLMLWALYENRKPLSALTGDDLKVYRQFLLAPPAEWCHGKGRSPARNTPEWRPFKKGLSASSVMTAMNTIRGLYTFFLQNGYISLSPFAQKGLSRIVKKDAKAQHQREYDNAQQRALHDNSLDVLINEAFNMPADTPKALFKKERGIFILQFGICLGARLMELSNAKMCDFWADKHGRWWWRVLGKGAKREDIPLRDDMVDALKSWRRAISLCTQGELLPPLPAHDDTSPVLRRMNGIDGIGSNATYAIIKGIAKQACLTLDRDSDEYRQLSKMSPHWLRHTAITQLAEDGVSDRYLQAFARHTKRETTEIYISKNAQLFHDAINK